MKRRHLILAVAVAALVGTSAASAGVRVKGIDASDYPTIRLSVVSSSPLAQAPTLAENGKPVSALRAENLGRQKFVVVAIDRSKSMEGPKFAAAIAAARAFVSSKPHADAVAVAHFGHRADVATRFSTASIDSDSALRTMSVDQTQGTALYDAVALSAEALRAQSLPGRVLVLLTDGRD